MTESPAGRVDTTGRRRTVRWVLQVLLAVGGIGGLGVGFVAWTILPLALESPRRHPATPRGQLAGYAARLLGLASLGLDPARLLGDLETMVSAGVQSGLVFVAALVLSRDAVPVFGRR